MLRSVRDLYARGYTPADGNAIPIWQGAASPFDVLLHSVLASDSGRTPIIRRRAFEFLVHRARRCALLCGLIEAVE